METTSISLTPKVPGETLKRFAALNTQLDTLLAQGLIVAFSGGVDSAFLVWAAKQVHAARVDSRKSSRLIALTAVSASMAQAERDDAKKFTASIGVEHLWQESTEVENPAYFVNDSNRCYHCKSELFRIAHDVAPKLECKILAYGYNASDRGDTRPGHRAALENGVVAPLDEAGLSKDDIRILMRAHDLPLAEKPASPCLSSRLMTGVRVTPEKLSDLDVLEAGLRTRGLRVFRVRMHESGSQRWLRLEVAPNEMLNAIELRDAFVEHARALGYAWVTLDLAGYRTGGGNLKPGEGI